MQRLINVFALLTIGVVGSILGGEYENPLHLTFLAIVILYAIIVDFLIRDKDSAIQSLTTASNELSQTKLKLSQLLIQSNQHGENRMYLAVAPTTGGVISCSIPTELHIVINTPFGIDPSPDIRLVTKERWGKVKVDGMQIFEREFANNYEYTISTANRACFHNTADKFFLLVLDVEFIRPGIYDYSLEAKSNDFHSVISNTFEVA